MKRRTAYILLILTSLFTGCMKDWDTHYEPSRNTVNTRLWDTLQTMEKYSEFLKFARQFHLDSVIRSSNTKTLFIPHNDGFTGFLQGDTSGLEETMGYHITPTLFMLRIVEGQYKLRTLEEKYALITNQDNEYYFDDVRITYASPDYLERVKANAPSRVWSALYQQDPVPEEGLFFTNDMFHMQSAMPDKKHKRYYMAWDFAISEKQRADYTVGCVLMQDENDNLILVDLVRFQGDSGRIANEFISMIHRWSNIEGSSLTLGVEDGQIWKSMKNMLRAKMKEEGAYVAITAMQALTDKQSRATALQGRMEHGRFYFLDGSPWLTDAQRELQRFPAGRNDDIVDALSWAVRLATGKKPKRAPKGRALRSWKDDLNKYIGGHGSGGHMSA